MKKILIADQSKASLVMISEVFKDHYPGVQVLVARSAADVMETVKTNQNIDVIVLDFDLPEENGAKTALALKKITSTPILITAFDRADVSSEIERLLDKYDDCRSWLKKPVSAEVVIAVVQRYCEGKIRIQKRLPCHIPVFAEVRIKNIVFSAYIEDCSLNGIKLKPNKFDNIRLEDWANLLSAMEQIRPEDSISIQTPLPADIENGKLTEISKFFSTQDFLKSAGHQNLVEVKKTRKKATPTISSVTNAKPVESPFKTQSLTGRIAWTSTESGEWCMGIEFENQVQSKQLFEAVVAISSRQNRGFQGQSSLKSSRF